MGTAVTMVGGNLHKERAAARTLMSHNPIAASFQECRNLPSWMRQEFPAYEEFWGGKGHTSDRWDDTVVLRHRTATQFLGVHSVLIAAESTPDRVAGLPRFASCQVFRCAAGPVALVSIHPHWIGPAHDDPKVDRVAKVDAGMRRLGLLLDFLDDLGAGVVVDGDLNVPEHVRTPGWTDPWEVLAARGFDVEGRNLDGVGVGPGLEFARRVKWLPPGKGPGESRTDHPTKVFRVRSRRA